MREQSYRIASSWSLRQEGSTLIVDGGADARFAIDLEPGWQSGLPARTSAASFSRSGLSPQDAGILDQLVTGGIAQPVLPGISGRLRVALLGDSLPAAPDAGDPVRLVDSSQQHDLVLLSRTRTTLRDLLVRVDYPAITKPHLLVDAAYHHTLSVGPLVIPGETACAACLQGRVTARWGDDPPPPSPRVLEAYPGMVREIVAMELRRIAEGDTSLVNATVAWNLNSREVTRHPLLTLPACPVCSALHPTPTGRLPLPWSENANSAHAV